MRNIIIQPKAAVSEDQIAGEHRRHGAKLKKRFKFSKRMQMVELPPHKTAAEMAREYEESGLVEFAEPDYPLAASTLPNDPAIIAGRLWGLNNTGLNGATAGADIQAAEAWASRYSAQDVIVAVIDTGVRYTHEDLAPNMWRNPLEQKNGRDDDGNGIVDDIHGYNAVANSGNPSDDNGHGTHVAGTIGAVGNNGKGVVGVSWGVQIMACKFMDADGFGDTSDAIACIDYARAHGASVINASWGGPNFSRALKRAIEAARNAGIIFVAAAGNEGSDNDSVPSYPANYEVDNIISVTATTSRDLLDSSYANFGAQTVDLAAPGSYIYSTWHASDSSYQYLSGTSMAAPHVAGAIALLHAHFPAENHRTLIDRLYSGVDKLPSLAGKTVTGGRLNLRKTLGVQTMLSPVLRLSANQSTQTLRITWDSSAGTIFRVLASASLTDPTWEEIGTVQATSSNAFLDVPLNTSSGLFFKVQEHIL